MAVFQSSDSNCCVVFTKLDAPFNIVGFYFYCCSAAILHECCTNGDCVN